MFKWDQFELRPVFQILHIHSQTILKAKLFRKRGFYRLAKSGWRWHSPASDPPGTSRWSWTISQHPLGAPGALLSPGPASAATSSAKGPTHRLPHCSAQEPRCLGVFALHQRHLLRYSSLLLTGLPPSPYLGLRPRSLHCCLPHPEGCNRSLLCFTPQVKAQLECFINLCSIC